MKESDLEDWRQHPVTERLLEVFHKFIDMKTAALAVAFLHDGAGEDLEKERFEVLAMQGFVDWLETATIEDIENYEDE